MTMRPSPCPSILFSPRQFDNWSYPPPFAVIFWGLRNWSHGCEHGRDFIPPFDSQSDGLSSPEEVMNKTGVYFVGVRMGTVKKSCKADCSSTVIKTWFLPLNIHNVTAWTSLKTCPWALRSSTKTKGAKAILLSPFQGPVPAHHNTYV